MVGDGTVDNCGELVNIVEKSLLVAGVVAGLVLLLSLLTLESPVMTVVQKLVLHANGVYPNLLESNSIPVVTPVFPSRSWHCHYFLRRGLGFL